MPVAEPDDPGMTALSQFKQEMLYILAQDGPLYGLAVRRGLAERYGTDIHHSRLYQNLDELVEQELITKSKRDDRTNEYALTRAGKRVIKRDAQRRYGIADGLDGRFGGGN